MKDPLTGKYEMMYRFQPHSENKAHSHNTNACPPTNIEPFVLQPKPLPPRDETTKAFKRTLPGALNKADLVDADYTHVAIIKKAEKRFNYGLRLHAPNGHLFGNGQPRGGKAVDPYKRWSCIYYEAHHCGAKAFTKMVNGREMAVFDADNIHKCRKSTNTVEKEKSKEASSNKVFFL